jgi:ssDNA-binding Zn-finger/Zn-ribbon topoisomerase 1
MPEHITFGNEGETEVCQKVKCPNCGKALMKLPKNYPLFDVQCSACSFRAQVKTQNAKPKGEILGAGWDILEKVLKSGYMVPSLIVNFKWRERKELNNKRYYSIHSFLKLIFATIDYLHPQEEQTIACIHILK